MIKIRRTRHTVSQIAYHLVWVTKCRRTLLTAEMWQGLKEILQQTADEHGYDIIEAEVMPDHVHCFVSAAPKVAPSTIVRHLKGACGQTDVSGLPSLHHRMWRGHLWHSGSYIGTAGDVSAATIKRYIQGQHTA